jgi:hypothetical protein
VGDDVVNKVAETKPQKAIKEVPENLLAQIQKNAELVKQIHAVYADASFGSEPLYFPEVLQVWIFFVLYILRIPEHRNAKYSQIWCEFVYLRNYFPEFIVNCNINKEISNFREKRHVCKSCDNDKKRINYSNDKELRDEKNKKRRIKYQTDEEHRQKLIKMAGDFKHNKVIERQKLKEEENQKIGLENKQCKYCNEIKLINMFRHNRLKCRDCERDEPLDKFKRVVRSRIISALSCKNKHTIEYLGCNTEEFYNWMLYNFDDVLTLDNYGSFWHIDHVIPISHFNLENEHEQSIAFNWKNTMPLSAKENCTKNNRLVLSQIEQHLKMLAQQSLIKIPRIQNNTSIRSDIKPSLHSI